jgi:hypothetical protein
MRRAGREVFSWARASATAISITLVNAANFLI